MLVPQKISYRTARRRHPVAVKACLAALARGKAASRLSRDDLTWHYEYCVELQTDRIEVVLLAKGRGWWWREAVPGVPPEVRTDAQRLRLGPYRTNAKGRSEHLFDPNHPLRRPGLGLALGAFWRRR